MSNLNTAKDLKIAQLIHLQDRSVYKNDVKHINKTDEIFKDLCKQSINGSTDPSVPHGSISLTTLNGNVNASDKSVRQGHASLQQEFRKRKIPPLLQNLETHSYSKKNIQSFVSTCHWYPKNYFHLVEFHSLSMQVDVQH